MKIPYFKIGDVVYFKDRSFLQMYKITKIELELKKDNIIKELYSGIGVGPKSCFSIGGIPKEILKRRKEVKK